MNLWLLSVNEPSRTNIPADFKVWRNNYNQLLYHMNPQYLLFTCKVIWIFWRRPYGPLWLPT